MHPGVLLKPGFANSSIKDQSGELIKGKKMARLILSMLMDG